MLDGLEKLTLSGLGVNQDDCLLVGSQKCGHLLDFVNNDPSVEAIDHAVAEANGDGCGPHGSGRAGQLGGMAARTPSTCSAETVR